MDTKIQKGIREKSTIFCYNRGEAFGGPYLAGSREELLYKMEPTFQQLAAEYWRDEKLRREIDDDRSGLPKGEWMAADLSTLREEFRRGITRVELPLNQSITL